MGKEVRQCKKPDSKKSLASLDWGDLLRVLSLGFLMFARFVAKNQNLFSKKFGGSAKCTPDTDNANDCCPGKPSSEILPAQGDPFRSRQPWAWSKRPLRICRVIGHNFCTLVLNEEWKRVLSMWLLLGIEKVQQWLSSTTWLMVTQLGTSWPVFLHTIGSALTTSSFPTIFWGKTWQNRKFPSQQRVTKLSSSHKTALFSSPWFHGRRVRFKGKEKLLSGENWPSKRQASLWGIVAYFQWLRASQNSRHDNWRCLLPQLLSLWHNLMNIAQAVPRDKPKQTNDNLRFYAGFFFSVRLCGFLRRSALPECLFSVSGRICEHLCLR